MFKTFSNALFATVALARGLNDGSSYDNAAEYRLLSDGKVEMTLRTWNFWNRYRSDPLWSQVHELYGELEIKLLKYWTEHIVFGFCINDINRWDCLRAEAGVNTYRIGADSIYASSSSVLDAKADTYAVTRLSDIVPD